MPASAQSHSRSRLVGSRGLFAVPVRVPLKKELQTRHLSFHGFIHDFHLQGKVKKKKRTGILETTSWDGGCIVTPLTLLPVDSSTLSWKRVSNPHPSSCRVASFPWGWPLGSAGRWRFWETSLEHLDGMSSWWRVTVASCPLSCSECPGGVPYTLSSPGKKGSHFPAAPRRQQWGAMTFERFDTAGPPASRFLFPAHFPSRHTP